MFFVIVLLAPVHGTPRWLRRALLETTTQTTTDDAIQIGDPPWPCPCICTDAVDCPPTPSPTPTSGFLETQLGIAPASFLVTKGGYKYCEYFRTASGLCRVS